MREGAGLVEVTDERWELELERMTYQMMCEREDACTADGREMEGSELAEAACGWESWICAGA